MPKNVRVCFFLPSQLEWTSGLNKIQTDFNFGPKNDTVLLSDLEPIWYLFCLLP